jgi:hypothetical protein
MLVEEAKLLDYGSPAMTTLANSGLSHGDFTDGQYPVGTLR